MDVPLRFEEILQGIPGLTVEQRRCARYKFLQYLPGVQQFILQHRDEDIRGFIILILEEWDLMYTVKRLWTALFPSRADGSNHRDDGFASNHDNARLLDESQNTNLRRRNVSLTAPIL
ncbi:hypothetical protein Vafri_4094, partial [Volvox africanus]